MEKVIIDLCYEYDKNTLKELFNNAFKIIGFKPHTSKILLKPNLLNSKSPDKAVTTHPVFIQAIAEVLRDFSCHVYIGDSPGYESLQKVLKNTGIIKIIEEIGLKTVSFNKRVMKKYEGISPYKRFVLGEDPLNYDLIINMPKLKTHTMMGMTLGVKNTFGFIHSLDKARWHLRAGQDRLLFASILIDIHRIVNPSLTILDGILGMDGDGPSNGRVRNFGIVAISQNAFHLDEAIERFIGIDTSLPITTLARKNGFIKSYEVIGRSTGYIKDFMMPETMATDWNLPVPIKGILKRAFIKKPKILKALCKQCNVCVNACPAGALSPSPHSKPVFDYKKCIRCYCCQEMCPEGAIKV